MSFRYSPLAESDLDEISAWSLKRFGADQTEAYLLGIEQACVEIGRHPLRPACTKVVDRVCGGWSMVATLSSIQSKRMTC
jgi:plasmid stabilization system protein ParE